MYDNRGQPVIIQPKSKCYLDELQRKIPQLLVKDVCVPTQWAKKLAAQEKGLWLPRLEVKEVKDVDFIYQY